MKSPGNLLKNLKSFKAGGSEVSLWIIKRTMHEGIAEYTVKGVNTETRLQNKLREIVVSQIEACDVASEYSFVTSDQDGEVFTLPSGQTNFKAIADTIANGSDNEMVKKAADLWNTWAYIIELGGAGDRLLAFRKLKEAWTAKKANKFVGMVFKQSRLSDLDDHSVFRVDTSIDVIEHDGQLFILNKKNFELGLNFRKGMEADRDELMSELKGLKVLDDLEFLHHKSENNLRYLRRLCTIRQNGYYRDRTFLANLRKVSVEEQWGLIWKGDTIELTENNLDLVITLLSNGRLKSPVNAETFDVEVKRKVKPPSR